MAPGRSSTSFGRRTRPDRRSNDGGPDLLRVDPACDGQREGASSCQARLFVRTVHRAQQMDPGLSLVVCCRSASCCPDRNFPISRPSMRSHDACRRRLPSRPACRRPRRSVTRPTITCQIGEDHTFPPRARTRLPRDKRTTAPCRLAQWSYSASRCSKDDCSSRVTIRPARPWPLSMNGWRIALGPGESAVVHRLGVDPHVTGTLSTWARWSASCGTCAIAVPSRRCASRCTFPRARSHATRPSIS